MGKKNTGQANLDKPEQSNSSSIRFNPFRRASLQGKGDAKLYWKAHPNCRCSYDVTGGCLYVRVYCPEHGDPATAEVYERKSRW